MFKVAMIGAGSVVFVKNLLTDILDLPELREVTIALHDIDAERLETAGMMARWTAEQFGANAKVEEHLDRRAALDGADFVINMVQIGMHEATLLDFEIPRKYGLKQTIADTLSIGGIFRGLRTIPFMVDMVAEMRGALPGRAAAQLHQPDEHPDPGGLRGVPGAEGGGPVPQRAEHRARNSQSYLERAGRAPVL